MPVTMKDVAEGSKRKIKHVAPEKQEHPLITTKGNICTTNLRGNENFPFEKLLRALLPVKHLLLLFWDASEVISWCCFWMRLSSLLQLLSGYSSTQNMSRRYEVSVLDYKSTNKINIIECMVHFKLLWKSALFSAILDPIMELWGSSDVVTAYTTFNNEIIVLWSNWRISPIKWFSITPS